MTARRGKKGGKGPGQVRVAGGLHKGRKLTVPPQARPTEGRVREALFSMWREPLSEGARLLDLFAGSGVVGLEAAGRGALRVVCVDGDRRTFSILQSNRDRLNEALVELRVLELPGGLAELAERESERFDLVFADPPYAFSGYAALVAAVAPLLAEGGEVAVEHSARATLPVEVPAATPIEGRALVRVDQRTYGESALSFYRVAP